MSDMSRFSDRPHQGGGVPGMGHLPSTHEAGLSRESEQDPQRAPLSSPAARLVVDSTLGGDHISVRMQNEPQPRTDPAATNSSGETPHINVPGESIQFAESEQGKNPHDASGSHETDDEPAAWNFSHATTPSNSPDAPHTAESGDDEEPPSWSWQSNQPQGSQQEPPTAPETPPATDASPARAESSHDHTEPTPWQHFKIPTDNTAQTTNAPAEATPPTADTTPPDPEPEPSTPTPPDPVDAPSAPVATDTADPKPPETDPTQSRKAQRVIELANWSLYPNHRGFKDAAHVRYAQTVHRPTDTIEKEIETFMEPFSRQPDREARRFLRPVTPPPPGDETHPPTDAQMDAYQRRVERDAQYRSDFDETAPHVLRNYVALNDRAQAGDVRASEALQRLAPLLEHGLRTYVHRNLTRISTGRVAPEEVKYMQQAIESGEVRSRDWSRALGNAALVHAGQPASFKGTLADGRPTTRYAVDSTNKSVTAFAVAVLIEDLTSIGMRDATPGAIRFQQKMDTKQRQEVTAKAKEVPVDRADRMPAPLIKRYNQVMQEVQKEKIHKASDILKRLGDALRMPARPTDENGNKLFIRMIPDQNGVPQPTLVPKEPFRFRRKPTDE